MSVNLTIVRKLLTILLLGLALPNCYLGGGGGTYHRLTVSINEIGLTKEDLKGDYSNVRPDPVLGDDKNNYRLLQFPSYPQDPPEDEFRSHRVKYYYSRMFNFDDTRYKLAVPIRGWVSIFDADDNLIKKLEVPRYSTDAYAFEVVIDGIKNLVVYVQQQMTSHSSTLFVLDNKFTLIYKEHLLGGLWIAAPRNPEYGKFVVSADRSWIVDDVWMDVGGPWLYRVQD